MARKSVFDLLKELKQLNSVLYGTKQVLNKDPIDGIGDRIEEEFAERDGKLNREEKELAHEYFAKDYQRSQNRAAAYLLQAKVTHQEDKYNQCLKSCWQLTRRAQTSYFRSRELCTDFEYTIDGISDALLMEHLGKFREKLYIMMEFPERYKEITSADLRRK